MVAATNKDSVIQFYPYQRNFFADDARVLVAVWCRQAGKDFTTAAKAVDNAMRTGQAWYIISLTQRQADATFSKCLTVSNIFRQAFKISEGIRAEDGAEYLEHDKEIDQYFRCRARTLHLPGGGSVTSLPGRDPDTLAGLTGNVIFTEFGLFPNGGYDHWRVVFPITTRGFKVIVISTPRGKNTKFYELASSPKLYSVHTVDLNRAVADGMPLLGADGRPCSIEQFKTLYNDEMGWLREYLCQFTGDLEALLTWSKLTSAAAAGRDKPFDFLRVTNDSGWKADFFNSLKGTAGRTEIGWDVSRRHDLSSLWVNTRSPGSPRNLRYLVLMKNCRFGLQREIVRAAMDADRRSVGCGDSTGLGMDSNEKLEEKYGKRWEPVNFAGNRKAQLGSGMRTAFDDKEQTLPSLEKYKYIATDLYAVQREAGTSKLVETANPLLSDSHCDIFYSAALAVRASGIEFAQPYISTGTL